MRGASDWLNQVSHEARPTRTTTQIWVVTCHQYGISAFVSQTSFRGETSVGVAKCRLFSQAMNCKVEQNLRCGRLSTVARLVEESESRGPNTGHILQSACPVRDATVFTLFQCFRLNGRKRLNVGRFRPRPFNVELFMRRNLYDLGPN